MSVLGTFRGRPSEKHPVLIIDYFLRNYHCNAYKWSHQRLVDQTKTRKSVTQKIELRCVLIFAYLPPLACLQSWKSRKTIQNTNSKTLKECIIKLKLLSIPLTNDYINVFADDLTFPLHSTCLHFSFAAELNIGLYSAWSDSVLLWSSVKLNIPPLTFSHIKAFPILHLAFCPCRNSKTDSVSVQSINMHCIASQ